MERSVHINEPAWYKLDAQEGSIDIVVHKKAALSLDKIDLDQVERCKERLELKDEFVLPSSDREWGFGSRLTEIESDDLNWIAYRCQLPDKIPVNDNDSSWPRPSPIDWDSSYSTAASLLVLLNQLNSNQVETDSSTHQMLLAKPRIEGRSHFDGSPLYVDIRPALCKWLNEHMGEETEELITTAMQTAYGKMVGDRESYDFRVRLDPPKWVSLDCPGDATGLGVSYNDRRNGEDLTKGYTLIPHNLDRPWQQLTLISGVAKLYKLAVE